MRKIRLLVLGVMMLSMLSMGVHAASASSVSNEIHMKNTVIQPMLKSSPSSNDEIIIFIYDFMTNSDTSMAVTADTLTSIDCDMIKVQLTLQEKQSDNTWSNMSTKYFSYYDTDDVTSSGTYYGITLGKTYRLKVYRKAIAGSASDDKTTYLSLTAVAK